MFCPNKCQLIKVEGFKIYKFVRKRNKLNQIYTNKILDGNH